MRAVILLPAIVGAFTMTVMLMVLKFTHYMRSMEMEFQTLRWDLRDVHEQLGRSNGMNMNAPTSAATATWSVQHASASANSVNVAVYDQDDDDEFEMYDHDPSPPTPGEIAAAVDHVVDIERELRGE